MLDSLSDRVIVQVEKRSVLNTTSILQPIIFHGTLLIEGTRLEFSIIAQLHRFKVQVPHTKLVSPGM